MKCCEYGSRCIFNLSNNCYTGASTVVDHLAHHPKVGGSSPAPAAVCVVMSYHDKMIGLSCMVSRHLKALPMLPMLSMLPMLNAANAASAASAANAANAASAANVINTANPANPANPANAVKAAGNV
jgi:hypothetical protein